MKIQKKKMMMMMKESMISKFTCTPVMAWFLAMLCIVLASTITFAVDAERTYVNLEGKAMHNIYLCCLIRI